MSKILRNLVASVTVSTLLLSATISTTPVYALTSDEAYAYAYNQTMNALSSKTQKAINDARQAINQLDGTAASWAIGEFSSKVDSVQQPILVKIVNAIKLAQHDSTQQNVNAARNTIDSKLPSEWRNSYSSALDLTQQRIMAEALVLYKTADSNKTKSSVNGALNKFKEIKTAKDLNIVNWAKDFESKLNDLLEVSNNDEQKPNLNLKYIVYDSEEFNTSEYGVNENGTIVLKSDQMDELMEGGYRINTTRPETEVWLELENVGIDPAEAAVMNLKFNNMAIEFVGTNSQWKGINYIHAIGLCNEVRFTENDELLYKGIPEKFMISFANAVVFENANIEVTLATKNGQTKQFKIPVKVK